MFDNCEIILNEDTFQDERYERESRYGSDLISHMPENNDRSVNHD